MNWLKRNAHLLITLYVAFVFIQSLFFKFIRAPETIYIFETKLEPWATSLGFPGLFVPGGIFSAYVVGSAELVASLLLLTGAFMMRLRLLQAFGALMGLGVISGAIFFHLFTPLGVEVLNTDGSGDGGQLFMLACGVWVGCAILLVMRKGLLLALIRR